MPDLDLRKLSQEDLLKIIDSGEGENHERYHSFNRALALHLARTTPGSNPEDDIFLLGLSDEEFNEASRILGKSQ